MYILTELPHLKLGVIWAKSRMKWPVFVSDDGTSIICYSGQSAIYNAIRALRIYSPGEVLMPSYHCGAEVTPVEATGLDPVFYRVDANVQVDLADIENRITKKTKALYLTHFFGFPGPVEEMAALARHHQLPLIEDCAPALFSQHMGRFLGTWGQSAIFSLTKNIPAPDGGLLRLAPDQDIDYPKLFNIPGSEKARLVKRIMAGILKRFLKISEPVGESDLNELESVSEGENSFDTKYANWTASWLTKRVLRSLNWQEVVSRRRTNYQTLLHMLEPFYGNDMKPLYNDLPEGVCPWMIPFKVSNPLYLKAALRTYGIGAVAVWSYFHSRFSPEEFPEAVELKRTVLALPIHQNLLERDMFRIARTLGVILTQGPISFR